MDLHSASGRLSASLSTRWIVAPNPIQGQVGDELAQLGGGVSGERGLQPGLVLVEREIALCKCLTQLIGGVLSFPITGPDGRCDWGAHGASRKLDLDSV
jgi:hypothetical protein